MAKKRDVYEVDLDIAAVEKKAARLAQLVEDLKAKRASGQDASKLEEAVNKELDGIGKLAKAEKEQAGATEELVQQKDKLAGTIGILSGQMGGFIGQLGTVGELMLSGSRAAVAFGGGLAAITGIVAAVQALAASWREVKEEAEAADKAARQYRAGVRDANAPIAEQLQALGILSDTNLQQAGRRRASIEQAGFTRSAAQTAAVLGQAEGLSGAEQLLAAQLGVSGVSFDPGKVRETIDEIRRQSPQLLSQAQAQVEALRNTDIGRLRAARSERDPGASGFTAFDRAREVVGEEAFEQFREGAEFLEGNRNARAEVRAASQRYVAREFPGFTEFNRVLAREQQRDAGLIDAPSQVGSSSPLQTINIGTVNLTPNQGARPKGPTTSLGQFVGGNNKDPVP